MQTVDLKDTLTITLQPEGTLVTCDAPGVPADDRNLVSKAVRLIREHHSIHTGICIDIRKRIPVAAGLAGGSGNAAMTLIALNQLWKLGLSQSALTTMGLQLGSDVPFCLTGGAAVARGRGEILEYIEHPIPLAFILVTPPCAVSSRWAYDHIKIELTKKISYVNLMISALKRDDLERFVSHIKNDLEHPVLEAFPVVGQIKKALIEHGAMMAVMSGSGPTVIGIVEDRIKAERVAARIRNMDSTWRVVMASPVSRRSIVDERGF